MHKKLEIAKVLLASKCNLNHQDYFRITCLHKAVQTNQTELVKLFIAAGADANLADADDVTPLHRAVGRISYKFSSIKLLVLHDLIYSITSCVLMGLSFCNGFIFI
jgi:ankyrin repeat protein